MADALEKGDEIAPVKYNSSLVVALSARLEQYQLPLIVWFWMATAQTYSSNPAPKDSGWLKVSPVEIDLIMTYGLSS